MPKQTPNWINPHHGKWEPFRPSIERQAVGMLCLLASQTLKKSIIQKVWIDMDMVIEWCFETGISGKFGFLYIYMDIIDIILDIDKSG